MLLKRIPTFQSRFALCVLFLLLIFVMGCSLRICPHTAQFWRARPWGRRVKIDQYYFGNLWRGYPNPWPWGRQVQIDEHILIICKKVTSNPLGKTCVFVHWFVGWSWKSSKTTTKTQTPCFFLNWPAKSKPKKIHPPKIWTLKKRVQLRNIILIWSNQSWGMQVETCAPKLSPVIGSKSCPSFGSTRLKSGPSVSKWNRVAYPQVLIFWYPHIFTCLNA